MREDLDHEPVGLEALRTPASVANDRTPSSSPLPVRPPRRRVLTHEEEVELSRRIENGEREALHSLLGTAAAAGPFRALADEVRSGRAVPSELLRNADEQSDAEMSAEKFAKLLERAA